MSEIKINISQATTATINKNKENTWFTYRPYQKKTYLFGLFTNELIEGFIYNQTISPYIVPIDLIPKKTNNRCYVINKKVMYYPHIDFTMSNGHTNTMYFDDVEELERFMKTPEFSNIKWTEDKKY